MKFIPVTVNRKPELPALSADGLRDPKEGEGFEAALITNSADPELPPPGIGFVTLTLAMPDVATSVALI
jgi:hypothetical protein